MSNVAVSSPDLLHTIVETVDGTQLQKLIEDIILGTFGMFKKESFNQILSETRKTWIWSFSIISLFRNLNLDASLEWETIEQYFFWQLILAHDIKLDWIQSLIPKLEYPGRVSPVQKQWMCRDIKKFVFLGHAEAISNITIMMKRTDATPTSPLLRAILMRDPHVKNDLFAVSALKVMLFLIRNCPSWFRNFRFYMM